MADLTANLDLIKPLGSEQANLFSTNGSIGVAEQNEDIIETYSARETLTDYTPVMTASVTNPNLGSNADIRGRFSQLQNGLVYGWATFRAAGTGIDAGSGVYFISLPVPFDIAIYPTLGLIENGHLIGNGFIRDDSNADLCLPIVVMPGTTNSTCKMLTHTFSGKTNRLVNSSSTFVMNTNDVYSIRFMYKAAL